MFITEVARENEHILYPAQSYTVFRKLYMEGNMVNQLSGFVSFV
jgi:hypothetical protein